MKRLLFPLVLMMFTVPLLVQAQRGYGPPPRDYDRPSRRSGGAYRTRNCGL